MLTYCSACNQPTEGDYVPMTVANDPAFKKYFKLKSMSMPVDQIKLKMEADGVDPDLLDNPCKVSPNDPGVSVDVVGTTSGLYSLVCLLCVVHAAAGSS